METFVFVIHILVAVFLIGSILLQAGKGADIGAAFGAGGSQAVFGPRGAATLLHKVTIVAAVLFLSTSVTLTYFSREEAASVLEAVPEAGEAIPTIPDAAKSPAEVPPSESPTP